MIKPEGLNIFTCENGYGIELIAIDDEDNHVIKRYIGNLDFVLDMAREFFEGNIGGTNDKF